jgi:hypothetical protein
MIVLNKSVLQMIGVWVMQCIGYDEAFQREILDKFQHWTPKEHEPKTDKGQRKKRKRSPSPASDLSDENENTLSKKIHTRPTNRKKSAARRRTRAKR